MAPETVNNSAYKLFENGEIKGRVDELQKEVLKDPLPKGFPKDKGA